jgi:hypothetical protein
MKNLSFKSKDTQLQEDSTVHSTACSLRVLFRAISTAFPVNGYDISMCTIFVSKNNKANGTILNST